MLFDTKGHCFERQIIMLNVRWYLSYKLSYRDLEEMAAAYPGATEFLALGRTLP